MKNTLFIAAAILTSISTTSLAADSIEGNWLTKSGESARISSCGNAFCIKLTTGKYKGRQIGKMSKSGKNKYKGSITDPSKDKTYSGKGKISGNTLSMSGCVFGGLICQSQKWKRR